ncbi:hypothetical protein CHH61_03535 [Shouchella clausii]|uniref:Uncharacterized protein n=1 Tax=Shouchella clausii TaxID=79880 RepID=A0A268S4G5_SHOCL|nr:hypothetical protein [Shouchella clausii]PAF27404.1 hypothetical protein CHH61_03535 [Shouchella clausii]
MLESNTDRSWFMIGAVILGGALIAGGLFIFKDVLFFNDDAVLPTLINNVFGKANDMINNISGL